MASPDSSSRHLGDLVTELAAQLDVVGVENPRVDAELLVSHVLGLSRGDLAASIIRDVTIDHESVAHVIELGRRRASREPLQHITGHAYFRSLDLLIGPGAFVPRPETELLVQFAIDFLRALPDSSPLAVDVGTGSGAIALSIATEVPHSRVIALEKSQDALTWARRNVSHLAASNVRLVQGDIADALSEISGEVDALISNPPYIPTNAIPKDPEVHLHDPHLALYGGDDGLDVIRLLNHAARRMLRPGGLFAIEHGEHQGLVIRELLQESGWRAPATHVDLLGRDRYTTAIR